MKVLFPLFILVFALFFSCKKKVQPDMMDVQNACDCVSEVSADFTIEEAYAYGTPFLKKTETDTCYHNRNVVFTAKEKDAEYLWYIGAEQLTQKSFARYFDFSLAGQNIPVTLVVKKATNKLCFPNDDGYDSIVKYFHVSLKSDEVDSIFLDPNSQFEGIYRMKDKNGVDSIDITIDLYYDGFQGGTLRIYNFDGQGANSPMNFYGGYEGSNYRQLWYDHNERHNILQLKLNGEVELQMINFNQLFPVTSYYYKGRKL